jgi:MFS transporter, PAT family, beta-lactamase induction signal transducer AmpG
MSDRGWWVVWGQRKMAVLLLLGFASGLPLYLTSRTLQAWMRVAGIDLATIGVFSLAALPYSLKWIWAPLMDRYVPPFLGRRRGWLIVIQVALLVAIATLALQDVVIDAYRADILAEREMGAGAAIWVLGYRVALLATGGLAFILADRMSWPLVYLGLAGLMLIGIAGTLYAREPALPEQPPRSLAEAVVLPFQEFWRRMGARGALLVLLFIVIFKLPDYLAASMATPFLLDVGFSQTDIGAIQGGLGIFATIVGALAGGVLVARIGINRSLWVVGALQAISNLAYYGLAQVGRDYAFLVGTIVTENLCTGLVSAAFLAFLMSLCSVRFSATQFALLSSLMGVSRDVLVSPSGAIAELTGWPLFFVVTVAVAIPGLLLLPVFAPWSRLSPSGAARHPG